MTLGLGINLKNRTNRTDILDILTMILISAYTYLNPTPEVIFDMIHERELYLIDLQFCMSNIRKSIDFAALTNSTTGFINRNSLTRPLIGL